MEQEATELQAGWLGFDSWQGQGLFFFSPLYPDWLWGPLSLYQMGNGGSFPGGKVTEEW